ncbi:MAG: chorismate-binding protein [Bradymonadia bacterium]
MDNFDSFTNNLWHLIYRAIGVEAVIIQNDHDLALIDRDTIDAVVISPGPGHPSVSTDVGICAQVLGWKDMPILGVCLGHQLIGFDAGASVSHAPEIRHGRLSTVHGGEHWLFEGFPDTFEVVRYHSWHVCELPDSIEPIAYADDGVLMALSHRDHLHVGVQFHPESLETEHGQRLIRNFMYRAGWQPTHSTRPIEYCQRIRTTAHDVYTHRLHVESVDWIDPVMVVDHFREHYSELIWLDSAVAEATGRQMSLLYLHGSEGERWTHNPHTNVLEISRGETSQLIETDLFEHIQTFMSEIRLEPSDMDLAFKGGLIGALSYEARWPGKTLTQDSRSLMYYVDRCIIFDHQANHVSLIALVKMGGDDWFIDWFKGMREALSQVNGLSVPQVVERDHHDLRIVERAKYMSQVEHCKLQLDKGESYELCLTTEVKLRPPACPWSYYVALRTTNPAPFAAYLSLPSQIIACSSPEKFLSVDAQGLIEAKPIKGTRARLADAAADEAVKHALSRSEKDCAENLMITDLLRHDIGANAHLGSVHVPFNRAIESYATVHQMVSTIHGTLRTDRSPIDVVRDAFPGGSMTGAPKRRSVQLLSEIEGRERGLYSGSIGYFSACGQTTWNIVIRTATILADCMAIGAGGAVVAQSDPAEEYREMLIKVFPLVRPLGISTFKDFETLADP